MPACSEQVVKPKSLSPRRKRVDEVNTLTGTLPPHAYAAPCSIHSLINADLTVTANLLSRSSTCLANK